AESVGLHPLPGALQPVLPQARPIDAFLPVDTDHPEACHARPPRRTGDRSDGGTARGSLHRRERLAHRHRGGRAAVTDGGVAVEDAEDAADENSHRDAIHVVLPDLRALDAPSILPLSVLPDSFQRPLKKKINPRTARYAPTRPIATRCRRATRTARRKTLSG